MILCDVIQRRLPRLCAIFGREFSPELADGWLDALEHEDPDQVDAAMRTLHRQAHYRMPSPGHALELIHQPAEDAAIDAWPAALEAIQTGRNTGDERIDETLRVLGGLRSLGDLDKDQRPHTRHAFIKAYQTTTRTEKREELPRLGTPVMDKLKDIKDIKDIGRIDA